MADIALLVQLAAYVSAIWSITVFFVQVIGNFQMCVLPKHHTAAPLDSR